MWQLLILLLPVLAATQETLTPRIIGGSATAIEKHPYMVSIHFNNQQFCGGSLIGTSWVLTAAHCVYGKKPSAFSIRVGSSYNDKGGTLITNIKNIIMHELYDDDTFEFDVALIKLPTPVSWNSKVNLVRLAASGTKLVTGSKVEVNGWGRTSVGGPMSPALRGITVVIIDQKQCEQIFQYENRVTPEMVCAGSLKGDKDTCQGDSGGPLVQNGVQIGIVSWGAECASPGYPGVYTRVPSLRSWISKHSGI